MPILQKKYSIIKVTSLSGVVNKVKRPKFSLKSWLKREFQNLFEKRFESRLGFRAKLIKTENQINFSLFGDISAKTNEPIVLGKDNWLFEKTYIKYYVEKVSTPMHILEMHAQAAKDLQDAIVDYGKGFLLIISPNKAAIYPEYLPEYMLTEPPLEKKSNYDSTIPLFEEYGVNYIDSRKFFLNHKNKEPYLLFTKGGTHWSYYGAYLIVCEMINVLEKQLNVSLPKLKCQSVIENNTTYGSDNEI
ncbi:hypothetical protein BVX93_02030 [bacterium B13(2017)]|nr:hypothetical protein BVX93_02030 [bacterium B13(2017)]